MVAFAANSVLCRLALAQSGIDPASFTLIRIVSGAAMMAAMCAVVGAGRPSGGSCARRWRCSSIAAAFSFADRSLPAGDGALLLFKAVQVTMVMTGIVRGEHPTAGQWLGLLLALAGLAALVAPGVSKPHWRAWY